MSEVCGDISMVVECSEIGIAKYKRTFVVASAARKTLAGNLTLNKLTSLIVEIELQRDPARSELFELKGGVSASILQDCVVCLAPVRVDIREDLYAQFMPEALLNIKEDIFTHEDPDHPETYSNDLLELGKLVQDQLSVAIDPYPRHEQACGDGQHIMVEGDGDSSEGLGWFPFRNLGKLLNKKK